MVIRKTNPGPYRLLVFQVAAQNEAVSMARRRIRAGLGEWATPLSDEAVRDVELAASELITNAVVHTALECTVTVAWDGTRLRVEVCDADPVQPVSALADEDAEHGRGLLLVSALAADWGVVTLPVGKAVWFEVGPTAALAGSARLNALVRAAAAWRCPRDLCDSPPLTPLPHHQVGQGAGLRSRPT
ncbi:ATP-binding protein [Streptomyces sp. 21So2-11]|uniref:ATP-binding protein n=1 Tax=Streptomyces sp. 21So2-11 TaxID=3144408 RepID=UPI003219B203